jgi:hypothetical protein
MRRSFSNMNATTLMSTANDKQRLSIALVPRGDGIRRELSVLNEHPANRGQTLALALGAIVESRARFGALVVVVLPIMRKIETCSHSLVIDFWDRTNARSMLGE